MNLRLLNEKDPGVYQRVDWLVDKLATKVHSYFWLDEYPGKHDFSRYWKDDGFTSWRNSLQIPDSDIILEDQCAKISDQQDRDKVYIVLNPGSELSICDCSTSEMGYLCEHICKVTRVYRRKESSKTSLSLDQYKQALIKMLHCVPHDSLIRDHAVSLTAFLQTQLNALGELNNDERSINEMEQQEVPLGYENRPNIEQHGEDGNLSDENGFHDEMDINPSSICVSPSELFAEHGVLPADILSSNEEKVLLRNSHGMDENVRPTDENVPLESHDPYSVINQHGDYCTDEITETVDFNNIDIDREFDERLVTHLLKKKKEFTKGRF